MKHCGFCICILLIIIVCCLPTVTSAQKGSKNYFLYVGTYTTGESKGIYVYRYNSSTGQLTSLGLAAQTTNPSFLAVAPNHKFLYAVNELQNYKGEKSGAVTAFSIEPKTGKLQELNEVASRGEDPCYISLDKTGK